MRSTLACTLAVAAFLASSSFAEEAKPAESPPPASAAPTFEPTRVIQMSDSVLQLHSPFDDEQRTTKLVEGLGVNLVLGKEYAEDSSAVQEMGGSLRTALKAVHGFSRKTANGKRRLELAAQAAPSGGFDIIVAGTEVTGSGRKANPDLAELKDPMVQFIDAQRAQRPSNSAAWLGSLFYQLNYTQSDRAIAALKALGYSTVEYEAGNGDNVAEKMFKIVEGSDAAKLPYVIKLIDPPKTSLSDPPPAPAAERAVPSGPGGSTPSSAVDLGGVYMHSSTAGDSPQRLLILHDKQAPEALERLLNTLQDLDAPARQVAIDAQIVEVTEGYTTDLGLSWSTLVGKGTATFGENGGATGTYDSTAVPVSPHTFAAKLKALETNGDATTLSSPSVLVLDGRQARIQVGKQIPLNKAVIVNGGGATSEPVYIPVGIVLNIKPRVNEDGKYVTMQVETIVSDTRDGPFPPTLDNRQVQSFVRVADNTPFVIAGLMSDNITTANAGLPWISRLPLLGILFRESDWHRGKREVIIVITPHVVPAAPDQALSYVVPKASDAFSTLDAKLFRNAYRVKAGDVSDLRFLADNEGIQRVLTNLRKRAAQNPLLARDEPFSTLLHGRIPGEEVLVHRMIYQIVDRLGYGNLIENDNILVYPQSGSELGSPRPVASQLRSLPGGSNTLKVSFPSSQSSLSPFSTLGAVFSGVQTSPESYAAALHNENRRNGGEPRSWSLLLSRQDEGGTMQALRNVVALKRILQLNPNLPTSVRGFLPGLQLLFPSKDDMRASVNTVDARTAQLFFESVSTYAAFQDAFEAETARLDKTLRETETAAGTNPDAPKM